MGVPFISQHGKYKGKYIKLGNAGFVRIADIQKADRATDGQGKKVTVTKKDGKVFVYRGQFVDHVKSQLVKEGIGGT